MGSRKRLTVVVTSLTAFALVVTAAASSGLYNYTDDERSGPEQPIEFSHAVHANKLSIDCLYCHTGADKSQHATVPAVSVCMGCHQHVLEGSSPNSAAEIAKLREFYEKGESIPWIRIHGVPEHVQFKHMRHVAAGVECSTCHGPVKEMNRIWLVPDTKTRTSSLWLPAAKLEMGWCMDCHLERGASDDCAACHF
jgi:hypothetical protein